MDKASSSATSQNVGNPYKSRSSRRSSRYSVKVQFRVSRDVYGVLRESVPNVSRFLRGLVYDALERLPVVFEMEETKLEVEVARFIDELEGLHQWQNAVLKHGSYAEAYLQKLKGGKVQDRKPFYEREPAPEIKAEEKKLVEKIVALREAIAVELIEKLDRLVELKKTRLNTCREEVKRE